MNKRRSLSNNSISRKSKKRKKSLFVNTHEYRDDKRPSFGDLSFDFDYNDGHTAGTSRLPKESTPAHNIPGSSRIAPKLAVHRRRGKAKHLSFSNTVENPEQNENKENGSSSLANDTTHNIHTTPSGSLVEEQDIKNDCSAIQLSNIDFLHSCKINKSDFLSAKTVTSDSETFSVNITAEKHIVGDVISNENADNPHIASNPDMDISVSLGGIDQAFFDQAETLHETNLKIETDVRDESVVNSLVDLLNSPIGISGDTIVKKGDTIVKKGDTIVKKGDTIVKKVDTIVKKVDTIVKKVDTILTKEDSIFANDDTIFANLDLTNITKAETFYGLPLKVKEAFSRHRSISELYDWQNECLCLEAIDKRQNLIYSLPTSSGKTLVAEILMLKEILVRDNNAILVLPYVSIVQEKVRGLSPFAVDLNFHIEEYAASKGGIPPKKRRTKKSIFIATIEKANAIVNSLIEKERVDELGLLVVDELHMIGEGGGRGSLLEILLTKVMFKCPKVQIVGMSATVGNMEEIQKFLHAEVYTNNFRPVQLAEYVKFEDSLFVVDTKAKCEGDFLKFLRKVGHPKDLNPSLAAKDPDHLLSLVMEVVPHHSCLIFCATKKNCESVGLLIAKSLPVKLLETKKEEKKALLQVIQKAVNGVCTVLTGTIPYGIAYHHSGLTVDERELIEEAYRSGVLSVLCCTSTLASGVNLPARRVILRSPYVGKNFMTRSQYKQMVGRAGRTGIDSAGESILVLQRRDKEKSRSLLDGPITNCHSSLFYEEGKGLRQLILSLLGLKICLCESEIEKFLHLSLFHIQQSCVADYAGKSCIKKEVERLNQLGLVANDTSKDGVCLLRTTSLGNAALKACVNTDLAPFVYNQLKKAATEGLVLINELHLLYLVTPLDPICDLRVDWMVYYQQVDKLTEVEVKACHHIGITQDVLCRKATGQRVPKASNFDEFIYKRFYLTLMILEMFRCKGLWDVVDTFHESRGFLQSLFSSAMTFTLLMVYFTEELSEMWMFKLLFQGLSARISKSKYSELLPLMDIPGVKQGRAMQLFKGGYRTLQHLAHVDPLKLTREIEHLHRRQAELIISSAKMMLQEKVESLREEADEMAAVPNSPSI